MFSATFNSHTWAAVPFGFWSVVFFVFGCMIGSFLNVCIHRMPLGLSIVTPPSHCPHCKYSIPWYLNVPLVTWLYLGGKCRNCQAPISVRYFLVELLTGVMFLGAWLTYGRISPGVALVCSVLLAGLILATFIDFEHFIIPDEITLGGIVAGVICSVLVPALHQQTGVAGSVKMSLLGAGVGAGVVYAILRIGKMMFGRQQIQLSEPTLVVFTEESLKLPDNEIPYGDLFYRKTDVIELHAKTVELPDRCYWNVPVRLYADSLEIGEEKLNPAEVPQMLVMTDNLVLPREAMGLGDVKFMGAIGAFLGWPAVLFSLMVSSMIGSLVGLALIVMRKREWSSRLPYGPYIALAAVIWMFGGNRLVAWWVGHGN
jgi:leader peptidase (prepilin peptidase)/N-methyltransferase